MVKREAKSFELVNVKLKLYVKLIDKPAVSTTQSTWIQNNTN